MREFEVTLADPLFAGLRSSDRRERNTVQLIECYNVVPSGKGIDFHEAITSLNADGIAWGTSYPTAAEVETTTITVSVKDYVTSEDLEGVSVYLDGVLKGTTDANGDLEIADVTVGIHAVTLTKALYVDSDEDDLVNDYIVVTGS